MHDYGKGFLSADQCFEVYIADLRMPIIHCRALRTTNLLERLFFEELPMPRSVPARARRAANAETEFAAMAHPGERRRAIRTTDFERRQMTTIHIDLDTQYQKDVGHAGDPTASAHSERISSKSGT